MAEKLVLGGFSNFRLVDFRYHIDDSSWENNFIEIIATDSSKIRHLKFYRPYKLLIEEGFSGCLAGMEVIDISERQWFYAQIEVRNFEQDPGITFFAKNMEIIGDETVANPAP